MPLASIARPLTPAILLPQLVWNHISCRVGDKTLITPGGVLFDEVTPENLVMDSSNITANVIHDAVYAARPDVSAVVHLHTEASVAVSCLDASRKRAHAPEQRTTSGVARYERMCGTRSRSASGHSTAATRDAIARIS